MTEPDELSRKKRLRAGHRASTTRILGQVQPSITSEPLDVAKINQLKRSLEEKLQSLGVLDEEILTLTPAESIEAGIVQADEIKERIYTALSRLDNARNPTPWTSPSPSTRADSPVVDPPTVDPPAVDPQTVDSLALDPPAVDPPTVDPPDPTAPRATLPLRGAKVKLPKISLPRFNGDPVKWTSFWDSYQSAINLNSDLSEVDKFNYLRSFLDHTASDAIAGLTLSSANYQQAVEILHKHFGNKQVISRNTWTPS